MLSQAELDLVRRDRDLPGLAKLLDAETFRNALQAAAGVKITLARLRYLRYKPGQNCLAAYTLDVAGATVECHAKAYRLADADKLEKAGRRANQPGPLGEGRFLWPRLGIEVCVFPNDNKLGSLALLADPRRREDLLRRHLPDRPDLWRSGLRMLAYKPERRWVGALEVNGTPQAVCKLYGESAFEAARVKSKRFVRGDVFNLAPLIGRSKGRRALFFNWQRGEVLSRVMLAPQFDAAALSRVGQALGELQQQKIPALPQRCNDSVAHATLELSEFIGFLLPGLSLRVRTAGEQLAAAISALPAANATIHGDFYAKQVLLEGDHVTVLDLDEAARGDALTDVGSFIAHLEREFIAGRIPPECRASLRQHFLEGYQRGSGTLCDEGLDLHTAERLFARLSDFFRTQDDHWPERTEQLLARVEAFLAASRRRPQSRRTLDPKLPRLDAALSPLAMELHMAKALQQGDNQITDVRLKNIRLRRHKPGRRALIEYDLEFRRVDKAESLVLLGKLRRRGVDAENLALCREWSTGRFAADSPDGIAIPCTFGAIAQLGITLQQRVTGEPLGSLLSNPSGPQAARRAADAVCKLHHCEFPPGRLHTIADELEILEARLTGLADVKPEWDVRLQQLLQSCQELARRLPIVSPRPIHRDFYHDQLLLDGNRVWLLDLDLLCAGDPALDAGNFVGHLLEWGIRSPDESAALAIAAAAFTERFLELSGGDLLEAVEIYATLTLARHVSISTQFLDRAPFTEQILELCEERCGIGQTRIHPPQTASIL